MPLLSCSRSVLSRREFDRDGGLSVTPAESVTALHVRGRNTPSGWMTSDQDPASRLLGTSSTAGSVFNLLADDNPVSLGVGETTSIGVKITLGPDGSNNFLDDPSANLRIRAEEQTVNSVTAGSGADSITASSRSFSSSIESNTFELAYNYADLSIEDADVITVAFPDATGTDTDSNSNNVKFSGDANNYAVSKVNNGGTQGLTNAGGVDAAKGDDSTNNSGSSSFNDELNLGTSPNNRRANLVDDTDIAASYDETVDTAFLDVSTAIPPQESQIDVKVDQVDMRDTEDAPDSGPESNSVIIALHQLNGGVIQPSFAEAQTTY